MRLPWDAEKKALDTFLRLMRHGGVKLTDWNGGVRRYGPGPRYVPIEVRTPELVRRLPLRPSLTVGEGLEAGELVIPEADRLAFFELLHENRTSVGVLKRLGRLHRNHRNVRQRQAAQIQAHYDEGNDYYQLFLDKDFRAYSCAYWEAPDLNLEAAQRAKLELVLRKLRLGSGMRLLDIGCGWGGLVFMAAEQHPDLEIMGITLSEEQYRYCQDEAKRRGVDDRVQFRLANYQDLVEDGDYEFDRIVSVGMVEHVGQGNLGIYFSAVKQLLEPTRGLSLVHTITQQRPQPVDAWVDRYIFPGGYLPTSVELHGAIAAAGMWFWHEEDLALHYGRTLREWRARHQEHRELITSMFSRGFYDRRDFWLAGCIINFERGGMGLSQIVFSANKTALGLTPPTLGPVYAP